MIPQYRLQKLSPEFRERYMKKYGDKMVYIYTGQWRALWRPNSNGYTDDKSQAGIYSLREAHEASGHCGPEKKIFYKIIIS